MQIIATPIWVFTVVIQLTWRVLVSKVVEVTHSFRLSYCDFPNDQDPFCQTNLDLWNRLNKRTMVVLIAPMRHVLLPIRCMANIGVARL